MSPEVFLLYTLAFCRIAIGLVFTISIVNKLHNLEQFVKTIDNFNILPQASHDFFAKAFLYSEITVVIFMVIGNFFLLIGFLLATFLLTLFCIALISILYRKIRTSCNCFSTSTRPISYFDICRNVGFIVCAFSGCITFIWIKDSPGNLSLLGWILTGLSTTIFITVWIQLGDIVQLFRQS